MKLTVPVGDAFNRYQIVLLPSFNTKIKYLGLRASLRQPQTEKTSMKCNVSSKSWFLVGTKNRRHVMCKHVPGVFWLQLYNSTLESGRNKSRVVLEKFRKFSN